MSYCTLLCIHHYDTPYNALVLGIWREEHIVVRAYCPSEIKTKGVFIWSYKGRIKLIIFLHRGKDKMSYVLTSV